MTSVNEAFGDINYLNFNQARAEIAQVKSILDNIQHRISCASYNPFLEFPEDLHTSTNDNVSESQMYTVGACDSDQPTFAGTGTGGF